MKILGISAFYHDSAAALIDGGRVVAAAQEERFSRVKHDAGFPAAAIRSVLETAAVQPAELDRVVFYEKPFLKFERLLETYVATAPRGFKSFSMAIPVWLKEKLFQKKLLLERLEALFGHFDPERLLFSEHHLSHAASAFYPSPFDEAAVLTLDGVGEWATTTAATGQGRHLTIEKEIHFPHSLGLLYSAFTYYCGFRVNSGEYKLMGLAPYGEPRYTGQILSELVDLKADGSFRLNQDYFDYATGLTMTNARFDALFGAPPRPDESAPPAQHYMDMAASVQAVTEEAVLRLARSLREETGMKNLVMAGGVALNCVANGRLARSGLFEGLWIQPAAGDAGGALGAALAAWHLELKAERTATQPDGMSGAYLGPSFDQQRIEDALAACGAVFQTLPDNELLDSTARALAAGEAVGWFQGRMEYGPRALGNRSILADPRAPDMQRTLNLKVKFRESFRPFAPAVAAEAAGEWFDLDRDSPYMLLVAQVAAHHLNPITPADAARTGIDRLDVVRSGIPAVTHVDGSARVQTVRQAQNPRFHALLVRFGELTGCPVLANTSFNVRGEPIVCSPADAFRCFMGTGLDRLVIGNTVLKKSAQDADLAADYRDAFAPD